MGSVRHSAISFPHSICGAGGHLCGIPLYAQVEGTGTLQGTITDPSGAVVAGATITATEPATGRAVSQTTPGSGSYVISALPPGQYTIEVHAKGFRPVLQENVTVNALTVVSVDLKLQVGSGSENVVVTSAPPDLDTENDSLDHTIPNSTYTALPLAMNGGEWIAGRFNEFNGYQAPVIFVDEYDQEHSRDIEPMRGGHGDNYYYQLADYIRQYKGSRKPPLAGPEQIIDLQKSLHQWDTIQPEFLDEAGETFHRDHPAYNATTRLMNQTGRKDLVMMKVVRDKDNIYFYATPKDPITPSSDANWRALFIDTHRNHANGWEGCDVLINHHVKDDHTTIVETTRNGWNWEPSSMASYRVKGNELMVAVARKSLGLTADPVQFEFKWADNWQQENSIDEFTLN